MKDRVHTNIFYGGQGMTVNELKLYAVIIQLKFWYKIMMVENRLKIRMF